MNDSGIGNTIPKLNIEAYTDEQLIGLGKQYLIQEEMYIIRSYTYFQSHKEDIRTKQMNTYNNDNQFRDKGNQQIHADYCQAWGHSSENKPRSSLHGGGGLRLPSSKGAGCSATRPL